MQIATSFESAQLQLSSKRILRKTRAHEEEPQEKSRGQLQEKQSSWRSWRVTRRAELSVRRGGVSGAEIKDERLRQVLPVHCGYYPYNIAIMTGAI